MVNMRQFLYQDKPFLPPPPPPLPSLPPPLPLLENLTMNLCNMAVCIVCHPYLQYDFKMGKMCLQFSLNVSVDILCYFTYVVLCHSTLCYFK